MKKKLFYDVYKDIFEKIILTDIFFSLYTFWNLYFTNFKLRYIFY